MAAAAELPGGPGRGRSGVDVLLARFLVAEDDDRTAGIVLFATVFAAVYHAEVVAHRVGEPFGTLVLAFAVTVIETALIVSVMISAPAEKAGLARDTVFAAVMIVCNGIVGLACSGRRAASRAGLSGPGRKRRACGAGRAHLPDLGYSELRPANSVRCTARRNSSLPAWCHWSSTAHSSSSRPGGTAIISSPFKTADRRHTRRRPPTELPF